MALCLVCMSSSPSSSPGSGPEGTPFEGGVFAARLIFPIDYPLAPPKMQFITDLFHPNSESMAVNCVCLCVCATRFCSRTTLPRVRSLFAVYPDGHVCISILHAPGDDPLGYESSVERWSPVQSVEKILLSVISMLAGACVERCILHFSPIGSRWLCWCSFSILWLFRFLAIHAIFSFYAAIST